MNRENVLRVADAIEQHSIPDLGFNMLWLYTRREEGETDNSGHDCGTVACIAGWSYAVSRGKKSARVSSYARAERDAEDASNEFMGLEHSTGRSLYFPPFKMRGRITPSQAVAVLRHLADTGEVDWTIADTVKP